MRITWAGTDMEPSGGKAKARTTQIVGEPGFSKDMLARLTAMIHQRLQALQLRCWVQAIAAQLTTETTRYGDAHFYAVFSRHMRLMLVDHARRRRLKNAANYGVGQTQFSALELQSSADNDAVLLRLHQALDELEHHDRDAAHACQLYYFGGHTLPEIAIFLGMTEAIVGRRIRFAKAWLLARCRLF